MPWYATDVRRFLEEICGAIDSGRSVHELPSWPRRSASVAVGVVVVVSGCHQISKYGIPYDERTGVDSEPTSDAPATPPGTTHPGSWPGASEPGAATEPSVHSPGGADPPDDVVVKYGAPVDVRTAEPEAAPVSPGTKYGAPAGAIPAEPEAAPVSPGTKYGGPPPGAQPMRYAMPLW